GTANPNEFYTFQIGVWAARKAVDNLDVQFSDLRNSEGEIIPASALRCFNLGGTNSKGTPFRVPVSVAKGSVLALWFGVVVPPKSSGTYEGTVTLSASDLPPKAITIRLKVEGEALSDHGDRDLWRFSRLRWLDSAIGQEPTLTPPFTAVVTPSATESRILNRSVQFAKTGLPSQITSNGKNLLAEPIQLQVTLADGTEAKWDSSKTKVTPEDPIGVDRETRLRASDLSATVSSRLEFDGYLNYRVTLSSKSAFKVKDIRLTSTFVEAAVPYFMGLGKVGGRRPDAWNWKWDPNRPNNMAWLGSVDAGVQLKLSGGDDEGDVPQSWSNQGQGGCTVQTEGEVVRLTAFTGAREIAAGTALELNFRLLITPFKPIEPKNIACRVGDPMEGITVRHLHHAFPQNPYINYPFLTTDALADLVRKHKEEGLLGVNLYYNQREISNHMFEIWPLRSVEPKLFGAEEGMTYLGDKAVKTKSGGGYPWLMEHLGTGYVPSWRQPLFNGETDASLTIENGTRYDNFYLEGASWLIRNTGVDGIYFDGIGLDRHTMRRLTRIMHDLIPGGGRRDAHLGNNFLYLDNRVNSANMYMEHFPYLDTLWIGEGFNYELGPDYWLVEVSGVPFGLPSDMLACSGTKPDYFRGMLFGMGYRPPDKKTAALWKFWDEFKIQDSQMLGWWDSKCPVQTSRPDILATAYKKAGGSLVVVASWANEASTVNLTIDYEALGLDPARVRWTKPNIEGIQKGEPIPANSTLELSPNGGAFLLIDTLP
ncbi:MAG: glycoside hydrolase domain-containing protein, partial [Terrimicrobiaceae bacterium]